MPNSTLPKSCNSRLKVISILWGTAPGGIVNYVLSLDQIPKVSEIDLQQVVIRSPYWSMDEVFLRKSNPFDIKIRSRFDLSWRKKICGLLNDINPDIVMVHAVNSYFVARYCIKNSKLKFKVVAIYHGRYHAPNINRLPFVWIFNRYAEKFLRLWADKVITLTNTSKKYLIARGVSHSKVHQVYNGIPDVNIPVSVRSKLRSKWGLEENDFLIGTTSRLDPIKGISFLLEAVSNIKKNSLKVQLILLGDGPQRAYLTRLATRLGIKENVFFLGYRNDVDECLKAFDLFALPSLSECHSIGLIEAMRAGLPIVCTNVGGNRESVAHDHDALVVNPKDVHGLTKAINTILEDKILAKKLGTKARKRYQKDFSNENMIANIAQLLLSISNKNT